MSFQDQSLRQNDYRDEYLAAKRAAVEAVEVGQETLAESARQSEQLQNAERSADHTQFALDKSSRMLRGMTWSGWFANLVSKDVSEEDYFSKRERAVESSVMLRQYEHVPEEAREAAQAIQNYYCNLQVLMACETDEQRATCRIVCDNMYHKASTEVSKLLETSDDDKTRFLLGEFQTDLSRLWNRQKSYQRDSRPSSGGMEGMYSKPSQDAGASGSDPKAHQQRPEDALISEQEDHLEFLSRNLDEMHSIAHSLHESVSEQSKVIDSLDTKSDAITDKTRMVTRRTDRLIQKKSWTPAKKKLHGFVNIRHLATGLYITNENGKIVLADKDKRHPQSCQFGLWTKQGDIFGLKNQFSDKWMGQTLFGALACSASSLGARDEWQADEDWSSTRIICCSAGFGVGGYLMVERRDGSLCIGKGGPETKGQADLWCLEELGDEL